MLLGQGWEEGWGYDLTKIWATKRLTSSYKKQVQNGHTLHKYTSYVCTAYITTCNMISDKTFGLKLSSSK